MKKIGVFTVLVFTAGSLFAQLDEGRKMLNYERFQSAANLIKPLVDKDPKNAEAVYWLGQTMIQNVENGDTAAVKQLYRSALEASPNNALLLVGMGEVELMEGKTADAKNRFEAAINMTKKKHLAPILIAVGRANVDTRAGDVRYAIEKLNQAATLDNQNPDIYMILGDAYRKLIDGGNAVTNYQTALTFDPKAARASFMMGRIYETQGISQENLYLRYYQDAINEDPNYSPVYYWLYMYYYKRDVNKAREYLDLYVKNADANSKLCYVEASLFYVSKMYKEAIQKADACIANSGAEKPYPNLYGLKAYAYDKLKEKHKAKEFFEEFFNKVNPDLIGPNDYATYGRILMDFPGMASKADEYINKAVDLDTVKSNKINTITEVAQSLYQQKDYAQAGKWFTKLLYIDDNSLTKTNLYFAGYSSYLGNEYKSADSILHIYQEKYPTDLLGWFLGARTNEGLDTTQVAAKPYWDQVIAISDTMQDRDASKGMIIPAYRYMVAYYYRIKNDIDSAYLYTNRILELVPDDATALSNKEGFEAMIKQREKNPAKND
ncbi:MAG TPA: tetratricopeptide repeat protein [Ginsengibacter sp.]|nr:tetratricopeptide repeat protein [Ginsengibacter sp.]HRP43994.1 tetratricopeptide repeat protein [Ginsengibacter sp.]